MVSIIFFNFNIFNIINFYFNIIYFIIFNFKCNKCNLYYDRDCLIKYILNNFKYFDKNNNKTFYIINYEISCPQCRKYFLTNLKINTSKESYSSNKKL